MKRPSMVQPTLLTRISTGPNSALARATMAVTKLTLVISVLWAIAPLAPALIASFATFSPCV